MRVGTPLRLAGIRHIRFTQNPMRSELAVEAQYFGERLADYGMSASPHQPRAGNRNSYAQMSLRLVTELRADPELIVLAHALPDSDMRTSPAGLLSRQLVGRPMVFGVSEQGRATPFMALRLAEAYTALGTRSAAVLILDQGTLFYQDPVLAELDTATDHAVGLWFTATAAIGAGPTRQWTDVPPDRAGALLSEAIGDAGPGPVTVTAGTRVPDVPGAAMRRGAAGQLCTSVWSDLAGQLAKPSPADRTILVTEYEPTLGYLSVTPFYVPAGQSC